MRAVKNKNDRKRGSSVSGGKVTKYGSGGSVKKKCKANYKRGIR